MRTRSPSTSSSILRGTVAGVGGTLLMTAFQELVEMPLTGRGDSFAPADLAGKVTGMGAGTPVGRRRLNWGVHFALGTMWGAAHGLAVAKGLRGQKAVHAVFGVVYGGDVLLNTALGLYQPTQWSKRDLLVDVADKYVLAQGTGAVFDRLSRHAG